MELLNQVNTQLLFPAAAVAVVLICAALVFVFGFHSAEQPQFDKLPLVVDDRKSSSKKRKTKDKKSSPNRTSTEDAKAKSEGPKKSPAKEKKEEKIKEQEKPKPKEKPVETRVVKKETTAEVKKGKKNKAASELEKPVDFDDAGWQEVPKKSDKKKVKTPEDKEKEKKESPAKKSKKKAKDADIEAARVIEDVPTDTDRDTGKAVDAETNSVDDDAATALLAKVKEFQRVLREAERREQEALGAEVEEEAPAVEELTEVKDLRSNKKKENKEKQIKKKANEVAALTKAAAKIESAEKDSSDSSEKQDDKQNAPVFDELGDTWTDAKASKKSKKKARKDQ